MGLLKSQIIFGDTEATGGDRFETEKILRC